MLLNDTLQRLGELRIAGMAAALEEQLTHSACAGLGFDERLALLVDHELNHRQAWRATYVGTAHQGLASPARRGT